MRLIDADKVLELYRDNYANTQRLIMLGETQLDSLAEGYTEAAHIIKYIMETVDAVPVVRCRDCQHSYDSLGGLICSYGVCVDCIVPPNFFCSFGERKEGER